MLKWPFMACSVEHLGKTSSEADLGETIVINVEGDKFRIEQKFRGVQGARILR